MYLAKHSRQLHENEESGPEGHVQNLIYVDLPLAMNFEDCEVLGKCNFELLGRSATFSFAAQQIQTRQSLISKGTKLRA